jgi:hypothetical protein
LQYLDVLKRLTPSTASKEFHDFLNELDEAGACQKEGDTEWLESIGKNQDDESKARTYSIHRADDAREKIRYRARAGDEVGVKIWSGRSGEECSNLEKDFTTSGTPGRLGCPFAGSARAGRLGSNGSARGHATPRSSVSRGSIGRRSRRASFHDPIKADRDVAVLPVRPPTAEGSVEGSHSVPLCPIRFLDQHSPEEVAIYFEKHKHELPKSHEMCVKRFQENEDALRNLDSKYANMVTMVTDLGKKHQPMFPDPDDLAVEDGEEEASPNAASKVERWAQDVVSSDHVEESDHGEEPDATEDDEDRQQRFDRSLKDIRVGESPSRPWGIHVPEEFQNEGDASSKKSDPTASPLEPATAVDETPIAPHPVMGSGRCPFSGLAAKGAEAEVMPKNDALKAKPGYIHVGEPDKGATAEKSHVFVAPIPPQQQGPQLVFNGPVFFGYPADQTASLMQFLAQRSSE